MRDARQLEAFRDLIAQSQRQLVAFLEADLELGFTFADLSKTERKLGNIEHAERSREHAIAAITTVRRFLEHVCGSESKNRFAGRVDELERELAD